MDLSRKKKVLDLFSGIGGFSLGLERTGGFETVAFCEIDPFCQKVLNKHWPEVPIYDDVRNVTAEQLKNDGITVDVVTGGFPCQDLSLAGKQKGITAERSGLWSELARIIGELRPRYAIVENVTALLSGDRGRWFGRVLGDLAEIGYDSEWHCIPASELGAHHHRDRVWIIAHPNSLGGNKNSSGAEGKLLSGGWQHQEKKQERDELVSWSRSNRGDVANPNGSQRERDRSPLGILTKHSDISSASGWEVEPRVGRVADGVPNWSHRLKGLGNAVVPQIPEMIGKAILMSD